MLVLNDMFENIILFLKRANSSDQIKSVMFFFLQLCIQVFEVLHYVSQNSNRFLYHFSKTLKYLRFSSHIVDFPRKNKI